MDHLLLDPQTLEQPAERAERFVSEMRKQQRPVFVFGRNVYSRGIIQTLGKIDGVIDDFAKEANWNGCPVVALSSVPSDAMVIVCSGGRTQTALSQVRQAGLLAIDYYAFLEHAKNAGLPKIVFNEDFAAEFGPHQHEFEQVWNRLHDNKSKEIYRSLVNFRLKPYIEILEGFEENQKLQYFEDFLGIEKDGGKGQVFLDIGCFDGATSLEFAQRAPQYQKIIAFEPEPSNFAKCKSNLAIIRDIEVHPVGLSSSDCVLKISAEGSASAVSNSSGTEISLRRLDDVIGQQYASFIKIDIEGGEADAIKGAAETIKKWKPVLAVSVYHKVGDFWRIPKMILDLNPNYKIYMRHYTETIYETVMFFVP